jgi:hypothetical protein
MGDQQSLSAFQNAAHESTTDSSDGVDSPSSTNPQPAHDSRTKRGEPLEELYEDIRNTATMFPEILLRSQTTVSLKPPSGGFITNGLPERIPALPASVGNWRLVVKSKEAIIYAADGKAYDERWGSGGAIHRVRMNLNNRGINSDGQFHRSSESLVGFTNGQQIRNASADDTGPMLNVPGHSVKDNKGDFACLHGTEHKSEDIYNAVVDLLVHLHVTPTPLANYVPLEPDTSWELTKLVPRTVVWKAPAPKQLSKDQLRLTLTSGRVVLSAYDESDSHPDRIRSAVPTFCEENESIVTPTEKGTNIPATSAGCLLVRDALKRDPRRILQESTLPERDDSNKN